MAKKRSTSRAVRKPSPRYGIAEWYGNDIGAMTPAQRQACGRLAVRQDQKAEVVDAPVCPFLSTLVPDARCNKTGGVCSIRRFDSDGKPVPNESVVTVCPNRFLQYLSSGESLFDWISDKMLDKPNATIVKETPFLRKIAERRKADVAKNMSLEAKEESKKAGRIDWIVVDPSTVESGELAWCAVETQALYFSGGKMRAEFDAYAQAPSETLYPKGKRRPDYRSSGPKRLWPQLDVKVPVLRNWGKKVVVVVDKFFFESMNSLVDPFPRARTDKEKRDNADVAWFVVDYDSQMKMTKFDLVFTNLESSRHALNATEPLSKEEFTRGLREVMANPRRSKKVFKA